MSSDGEEAADEVLASCDKVEVDDKAQDQEQEELKKCDTCEDYSNEIIIENDTQHYAASPPEEHDIIVEAFAGEDDIDDNVPEDDIAIAAAEQGENNNNNGREDNGEACCCLFVLVLLAKGDSGMKADKEAVVQHPPQPNPSSSDNVPVAQGSPTISICDIFHCFLEHMPPITCVLVCVGIIMIVIGGVSNILWTALFGSAIFWSGVSL